VNLQDGSLCGSADLLQGAAGRVDEGWVCQGKPGGKKLKTI